MKQNKKENLLKHVQKIYEEFHTLKTGSDFKKEFCIMYYCRNIAKARTNKLILMFDSYHS